MHQPRTYRRLAAVPRLTGFRVSVLESDLHVQAAADLSRLARELTLEHRGYLEAYIRAHPGFAETLVPWEPDGPVPGIVAAMTAAGAAAGVGPMAAVAGAIAEAVGRGLLAHSNEVVVENGGDIFLQTDEPALAAVYAGTSPLSLKVGLRVGGGGRPCAVCTSSGTVGHSLSLGRADAATVVARSGALADAAATAVGNRVGSRRDLAAAIEFGRRIPGVEGIVVIAGDRIGAWGGLEIVSLG
jgi:hypothetical protein